MGIEALSRGAATAVFVDSAPAAVRTIRLNLAHARMPDRGQVRHQDARRALRSRIGQFDLVVLDPPYATPAGGLDAGLRAPDQRRGGAPPRPGIPTRAGRAYTPLIP